VIVVPETRAVKIDDEDKSEKSELADRKKVDAENKKRDEEDAKAAKEQAEKDDADIEAFLAVVRGEKLLRGEGGSFNLDAFLARREAERKAEDED
jgi:hypothetical protein